MKTSQSKLFRKLAINRRSNRADPAARTPSNLSEPIPLWWKARNVKDSP